MQQVAVGLSNFESIKSYLRAAVKSWVNANPRLNFNPLF